MVRYGSENGSAMIRPEIGAFYAGSRLGGEPRSIWHVETNFGACPAMLSTMYGFAVVLGGVASSSLYVGAGLERKRSGISDDTWHILTMNNWRRSGVTTVPCLDRLRNVNCCLTWRGWFCCLMRRNLSRHSTALAGFGH